MGPRVSSEATSSRVVTSPSFSPLNALASAADGCETQKASTQARGARSLISARDTVSTSARTAIRPGVDGTVGTISTTRSRMTLSPSVAESVPPTLRAGGVDERLRHGDRHGRRRGERRCQDLAVLVEEVGQVQHRMRGENGCLRVPAYGDGLGEDDSGGLSCVACQPCAARPAHAGTRSVHRDGSLRTAGVACRLVPARTTDRTATMRWPGRGTADHAAVRPAVDRERRGVERAPEPRGSWTTSARGHGHGHSRRRVSHQL